MKITGTAIRLAIVSFMLLLFTAIIFVVFGQFRFEKTTSYTAEFSNASGLKAGQFVTCGSWSGANRAPAGATVRADFPGLGEAVIEYLT